MNWLRKRVKSVIGKHGLLSIPETIDEAGDCLKRREELCRQLQRIGTPVGYHWGPPDLVCVYKERVGIRGGDNLTSPSTAVTYHHVIGVDCSSTAGIAAYTTELVNDMPAGWAIRQVTYCCWSVTRQRDVRVEAQLPGSLRAWEHHGLPGNVGVGEEGERELEEADWRGLWLSGCLRSLHWAGRGLPGLLELAMDLPAGEILDGLKEAGLQGWEETFILFLQASQQPVPGVELELFTDGDCDLRERLRGLLKAHEANPSWHTLRQLLRLTVDLNEPEVAGLLASELLAQDCFNLASWVEAAEAHWSLGNAAKVGQGN